MRSMFWRRLLLVLSVLTLALGGIAATTGFGGYQVKLDFTNADGLVEGEWVTINGVNAGQVKKLEVSRASLAVVTVSINSEFAPLRADTKAVIRSTGLLGNKYIDIIPGKGAGELASDSELTIDSTTSPTDLDQINAIFDAPTREKLRLATLQGKIALGGRAQTLNADLMKLRNLAVAAEPLTGVLDEHQKGLDDATVQFDMLTQKLAREDAALHGLVDHGANVFAALDARNRELGGLLAHGDATFNRLDTILAGNEDNLAGFFARQPSALASTNYILDASIPATRAVQPLLPNLFDLVNNMADSTSSRTNTGDPNNPNSDSTWALRAMAVICDTVKPSSANTC